ncbi:hypothetical protein [Roseateles chitinivorans]|uniref:hypothetical protein n=1 Tax=Roseateles chitinivorans TaxID=2917965 RepID=UPI003D67AE17
MTDNVLTSLPPTDPDRWELRSLTRSEDARGIHLLFVFDCPLAESHLRARAKRLLARLGLTRAADRIATDARVDIELFAIQKPEGDIVDDDGVPRADLFAHGLPLVRLGGGIELEVTLAQGAQYYLLTVFTDEGWAEIPALDATVRWRLMRSP